MNILLTVYGYEMIMLKENNHLYVTGEINNDLYKVFMNQSGYINNKDIYIYINSDGGSVSDGNLIIETIRYMENSGHNIYCIAQKAYSMAFHILQHCPHRYITETSSVMQHQISFDLPRMNLENAKSYLTMIERLYDQIMRSSSERIKMPENKFKELCNNDWWIYGQDIIDTNIADKMVSIGCDKELIKKKILYMNENDIIMMRSGCPLLH